MKQPQTRRECTRMGGNLLLLRADSGGDIEKVGTKSAAEPPPPSPSSFSFLSSFIPPPLRRRVVVFSA